MSLFSFISRHKKAKSAAQKKASIPSQAIPAVAAAAAVVGGFKFIQTQPYNTEPTISYYSSSPVSQGSYYSSPTTSNPQPSALSDLKQQYTSGIGQLNECNRNLSEVKGTGPVGEDLPVASLQFASDAAVLQSVINSNYNKMASCEHALAKAHSDLDELKNQIQEKAFGYTPLEDQLNACRAKNNPQAAVSKTYFNTNPPNLVEATNTMAAVDNYRSDLEANLRACQSGPAAQRASASVGAVQ